MPENKNQKIASVKSITGTLLLVVSAVVMWPKVRNFLTHNTRTQVHRINY